MRGELELCGVLLNVSMVLRVGGGWIVMLRGYTAFESLGLLFNCGIIWGFCFVVTHPLEVLPPAKLTVGDNWMLKARGGRRGIQSSAKIRPFGSAYIPQKDSSAWKPIRLNPYAPLRSQWETLELPCLAKVVAGFKRMGIENSSIWIRKYEFWKRMSFENLSVWKKFW